jgi:hypothetical protein
MALEWLREAIASARTSKILVRAVRAYREGDLPTARAALDEVMQQTEPAGSPAQRTHRLSVRLMAVTLRAEVAAQQGDAAIARASIDEGFALWEASKGAGKMGYRSHESYESWERWARSWLARQDGAGPT